MKKNVEVLIIGAGLSGLMAAAKAVESGKKVLLVAKGMGAIGLSSGCIDLWGYSLDNPEHECHNPIAEISNMVKDNHDHPYALVEDVLEESISFFRRICADYNNPYLDNDGGNWLLPTALGTIRPTYLAPASMAVSNLHNIKRFLVIGFEELKDFYPDVLVDNLKNTGELHVDCQLNTLLVSTGGEELSTNNLAHLLEKPEVINKVINQIKPHITTDMVLLFPPVLGEGWDSAVVNNISQRLGCPVYEVANIPPALPGQRLQQMLLHHIKKQGVELIIGCTVTGALIKDKNCIEVLAKGSGKEITINAKNVILATGSFLGGGLSSKPSKVWESIFHLPVEKPEGKWSTREFLSMEGQPFNKIGIKVDQSLRPVGKDMKTLIDNLFVTGANLSGCNYPLEKCGNGVALATGYKAGKLVGEVGQ